MPNRPSSRTSTRLHSRRQIPTDQLGRRHRPSVDLRGQLHNLGLDIGHHHRRGGLGIDRRHRPEESHGFDARVGSGLRRLFREIDHSLIVRAKLVCGLPPAPEVVLQARADGHASPGSPTSHAHLDGLIGQRFRRYTLESRRGCSLWLCLRHCWSSGRGSVNSTSPYASTSGKTSFNKRSSCPT